MTTPKFEHFDLKLHNPPFDSPLVDVVTELEHLRRLQLGGTTPPEVFFQLKQIFHLLESLGSARIEGNHTTLADLVETTVQGGIDNGDQMKEIANIEAAMKYVEAAMEPGAPLTETFIRDLHSLAVSDLEREGDRTPGAYKETSVRIAMSAHLPPEAVAVTQYMKELTDFVNEASPRKYDLIKVAEKHVVGPALELSRERQLITNDEYHVLMEVVRLKSAKSADLVKVMPKLSANQRTYQIKKLVDQKMLQPIYEGARQYSICFTNNYLLRGIVKALADEGFVPKSLEA